MAKRVTVIIPTLDRCDLLGACLASLDRQTFRDFDVLVVDDGSEEDIAAFVRRCSPDTRTIRLHENRGFAAAANAGLREGSSEIVLLLNNDMTLAPECVGRLVDALDREGADMAAPLVLWKDDPETVYSAGDRLLRSGRPESIGFRCARKDFAPPKTVFGVSAGAAAYRREVFDAVGGFDEAFVAYFEDVDLCFRARLAGFEAVCAPEAVACHVGSASQAGKTWWRSRQCYRNHALLVLKNMPLRLMVKYAPQILRERFHQTRMLFSSARAEFGSARAAREWVSAWSELTKLVPYALRKRRRNLRTRALSVASLEASLSCVASTNLYVAGREGV